MSGTTAPKVVQGAAEAAWSAHAPRLAGAPAAELQRVTTARIARAGCRVLRAGGRGFLRLRRRWVRAALAPRARSITSGGLLLLGSIMIPLTFRQAEGCPTRARSTRAHNGRQEEEEAGPPAGGGGALCRRGVRLDRATRLRSYLTRRAVRQRGFSRCSSWDPAPEDLGRTHPPRALSTSPTK